MVRRCQGIAYNVDQVRISIYLCTNILLSLVCVRHHDVRLTDGAWSESKPSVFYTTRADGCMDGWDILQKQRDPILTIKVFG